MRKKKRQNTIMAALLIAICVFGAVFFMRIGKVKPQTNGKRTVVIEIRCDELTKDLSKLAKPEIASYLPKDGVILKETECEFQEGDTVFDVLKRVCEEQKIPLEYSYTPGYDSYYVEGIGHLYEFYAGKKSGWVYEVNDEKADDGCSQYELTGKEHILWNYICDYTK